MRKVIIILISLFTIFLISCTGHYANRTANALNKNAEREGSPYRYKVTKLSNGHRIAPYLPASTEELKTRINSLPPTQTVAPPDLQKEIIEKIWVLESKKESSGNPKLVEIKAVDKVNEYLREAWIIDKAGVSVIYLITLKDVEAGITECNIYDLSFIE